MKELNLNAYGVAEMDIAEMQYLDGGIILGAWGALWKIGVAIVTFVEAMDVGERFMEGWNSCDC